MRNLSVELRPQSFDELIGAEDVVKTIQETLKQGRVPSAFLFSGSPGSGKTTIARILAKVLQGPDPNAFLDLEEINTANCNTAEDARALIGRVGYSPIAANYKVVIMDECQRLTTSAQQILLKDVEEPHDQMVWMLCTSQPEKIDGALRRRCLVFALRPLTPEEVGKLVYTSLDFLHREDVDCKDLVDTLVANKVSSPGLVIQALDKFLAGVNASEAVQAEVASVDALQIAQLTAKGNWEAVQEILINAAPDDGRIIRSVVAGYFRSILLQSRTVKTSGTAASAIHELRDYATWEDGFQLSVLAASLFKICSSVNEAGPSGQ